MRDLESACAEKRRSGDGRIALALLGIILASCAMATYKLAASPVLPSGSGSPSAVGVDPAVSTPAHVATSAGTPDVQTITLISAAAIKSAQDSVEQVKWVFSIASVVITGLLAVLAFLGFQNIRNIAKSVRDEARRRVDDELVNAKKIISLATQIAVRTQAALRQVTLAEKWAETDGNRQALLRKAIVAVSDVRVAAEELNDMATRAWTHAFEAYCLRSLFQFEQAVNAQIIAMQLSEIDDPLDRYNAACFYALVGNVAAASLHLAVAIENGGERFKVYARNDVDFAQIREKSAIMAILGPADPINPVNAPEKSPPSLFATKAT